MAKGPVKSGGKMPSPKRGANGPGDGGRNDGSRHFMPPMPKSVRSGVQAGKKK